MTIRSLKNGTLNTINGANTSVAVPTEPATVSISSTTTTTDIVVSFTPDTKGSAYTEFVFTSVSTSGTTATQTRATTSTANYTFTGAQVNQTYEIDVQAKNANGLSTKKRSSNSVTLPNLYALTQTFTSSGTFTVPSGHNLLAVSMTGGGAAGNAGGNTGGPPASAGGNGGAGSRSLSFYDYAVTPGQTFSITIAAAGGSSTFSNLATTSPNVATGPTNTTTGNAGTGGNGGNGSVNYTIGGTPGTAANSGGVINALSPGMGTWRGGGGGGGGTGGTSQTPGPGASYGGAGGAPGLGASGTYAGTNIGGNGGGNGGQAAGYGGPPQTAGNAGGVGAGGGGGAGAGNTGGASSGGAGGIGIVLVYTK
jgi:hypothetical protein